MTDAGPPLLSLIDSGTKGVQTAVYRRADGREFLLHSRENPVAEARLLVRDVPRRERTLYIVAGFGLGYHVRELLDRVPESSRVVVIEPESACLSRPLLASGNPAWSWASSSRLHFLIRRDPGVVPIQLADHMVRRRLLSIHVVPHASSIPTAEEFYQALLREIPGSFPACFENHRNSLDRMLENDLRNFWENLRFSWNAPPAETLRGLWSRRPLLLVSPGPSLAGALPLLQRRCGAGILTLAAAPAAGILLANGVRPDLAVSVDPYEMNQLHFRGWDTAAVPLVYYHRIHRGVLPMHLGSKLHFVMQDEAPLPVTGSRTKSNFWRGGSVAFSALQLAHLLDANPVVFVGQDFAFAGNHTHCSGAATNGWFDPAQAPADFLTVPGVDGRPVMTNRNYNAYRLYLQNYLNDYARHRPEIRHVNTSPSGALILGAESGTLDEVLETFASPLPETAAGRIASTLAATRPAARGPLEVASKRWRKELSRCLEPSERSADFERLFRAFRATSLYPHAAKSYDDIYYLYELGGGRESESAGRDLAARFREHLRCVLDSFTL